MHYNCKEQLASMRPDHPADDGMYLLSSFVNSTKMGRESSTRELASSDASIVRTTLHAVNRINAHVTTSTAKLPMFQAISGDRRV